MPLLTPEHDALADTWFKVTLVALKAKDPAALKAGMDAYVTPVDVFWKYPWHYTNNQEAEVLDPCSPPRAGFFSWQPRANVSAAPQTV